MSNSTHNGAISAGLSLCNLIETTLGTNSSIKCVVDGNDSCFINETSALLSALEIQHPIGQYIVSVCQSFYQKHGCGVKTLLFMIGAYLRAARNLKEKGVPQDYIIKYLYIVLELCLLKVEELKIKFDIKRSDNLTAKLDGDETNVQNDMSDDIRQTPTSSLSCDEQFAYKSEIQQENISESNCFNDKLIKEIESQNILSSNGKSESSMVGGDEDVEILYLEMKGAQRMEDIDEDLDWLLEDRVSKEMLGLETKQNCEPENEDTLVNNCKLNLTNENSFERLKTTSPMNNFNMKSSKHTDFLSNSNHGPQHIVNNNVKSDKPVLSKEASHNLNESDDEFDECFEGTVNLVKDSYNDLQLLSDVKEFQSCEIKTEKQNTTNSMADDDLQSLSDVKEFQSCEIKTVIQNTTNSMADDEFDECFENVNFIEKTTRTDCKSITDDCRPPATKVFTDNMNKGCQNSFEISTIDDEKDLKKFNASSMVQKEVKKELNLNSIDYLLKSLGGQKKTKPASKTILNNSRHYKTFDPSSCSLDSELDSSKIDESILERLSKNRNESTDKLSSEKDEKHSQQSLDLTSVNNLLHSLNVKSGKVGEKSTSIINNSRHFRIIESCIEKPFSNPLSLNNAITLGVQVQDNLSSKLHNTTTSPSLTLDNTNTCTTNKQAQGDASQNLNPPGSLDKSSGEKATEVSRSNNVIKEKHCSTDLKQGGTLLEFPNVALGLSHGNLDMMQCLLDTIGEDVSISEESTLNIECLSIVGPLSQKPEAVHGAVVKARPEMFSCLHKRKQFRTVIMNGEFTSSYRHIGYKATIQNKVVISDFGEELGSKHSWLDLIEQIIEEFSIQCFFIRGSSSPDILDLCLSKDVVVIDNVQFKTLQRLANHMGVTMVTYVEDIYEETLSDFELVPFWEDWMLKLSPSFVKIIPTKQRNSLKTVVLCHPSQNGCDLLENQFHRLRSILESALCSGFVLPGGGITEETICQSLIDHPPYQSDDLYLPVVCEEVAFVFRDYVQTVRRNIQNSETDQQTNNVFDNYRTKIDAWKTALNTAVTILQTEFYIINGANKDL